VPILHAIVLGVVQGLTEFLPVSSSGHLLLTPWLFGWHDFGGNASFEKTFDVALHLGTLVGAVAYFRKDLLAMLRAVLAPARQELADERRLAWLLVLSAVPGAIIGGLFETPIEHRLGKIWLIAVMLIVFGLLLLWADRLRGHRPIDTFRVRDAVLMGAAQAIALQPGVSRSGVTITVGRKLGFDRDAVARLSFLMSLPIIAGAVVYKGAKLLKDGFPHDMTWPFISGIVASGITGYAAVWLVLRLVRTRSFTPFVIYRVLAGATVLGLLASSFR
jgi:undecaprenyl-diphosphatase